MTLLTVSELASSYGGIGTIDPNTWSQAILLAEFDVESALGTFLTPTTVTNEEHLWPYDTGNLTLRYRYINSITSVVAKHSLSYDCVWMEDTQCGVVLRREDGYVHLHQCRMSLAGNCNCGLNIIPDRAVITYIAGFTTAEGAANSRIGRELRMAIALRAREWAQYLEQGDSWEGNYLLKGFSSMDYSEQRSYAEQVNPLGPGQFSQEAWRILKNLKPYTAHALRSTGRI